MTPTRRALALACALGLLAGATGRAAAEAEFYTPGSGRLNAILSESVRSGRDPFIPLHAVQNPALKAAASGVVMLTMRRVAACMIGDPDLEDDPREHGLPASLEVGGVRLLVRPPRVCTAWRLGENSFVTAAHCVTSASVCKTTTVHFPDDAFASSRDDGDAFTETSVKASCAGVIYMNRNLDVVVFRVSPGPDVGGWADKAAILSVPSGDRADPLTRRKPDKLALVQYPTRDRNYRDGATTLAPRTGPYIQGPTPFGLSFCNAHVVDARLDRADLPWQTPVENACGIRAPRRAQPERAAGFWHNCNTTDGSSGAPILSIDKGYSVAGIHVAGGLDQNVAVRASAVAKCVSWASLAAGAPAPAPGAGRVPGCRAAGTGGRPPRAVGAAFCAAPRNKALCARYGR